MKKTITLLLCTFATSGLMAQGNTSWIAAGIDRVQMRDVPSQSSILRSTDMDYSQGTFIVNEDWYGHQNSTVNFLTQDGEWHYRVFQTENPGHELGCTTQFGTIYGDKFYLVSKQERDPGAKITGSRFAVCDAKTMKVIKEFKYIAQNAEGKSIADGRSYLPVDEHKGYIGTSNGIWIYDSDKMAIGKQIEGSGNPNADGYGELYYAQIGTMVRANDLVFAVHQQYGLLIIDPKTDKNYPYHRRPDRERDCKRAREGDSTRFRLYRSIQGWYALDQHDPEYGRGWFRLGIYAELEPLYL